jgi:hypothetical protein
LVLVSLKARHWDALNIAPQEATAIIQDTTMTNDTDVILNRLVESSINSEKCGGFWEDHFPDMLEDAIGAISSHLLIDQKFDFHLKGLSLLRVEDKSRSFQLDDVKCNGHIGNSLRFIRFEKRRIVIEKFVLRGKAIHRGERILMH